MDMLDKLLAFAQVSAGLNVKCQLQGDWQLETPFQQGQAVAHIVSQGSAYLHLTANGKQIALQEGDIVFFSRSQAHTLSNQTSLTATTTNIQRQELGGFMLTQVGQLQSECDLFCLHFQYDPLADLMQSLPEMFILHTADTPLQAVIALLKQEAQSPGLASISVVNSLALIVLTMILRHHLANHYIDQVGILKGWKEPRLHTLLRDILLRPEQNWQVDEMAEIAHLSRSQLIRLFNKHLGSSPHAFVHKIRLQKAAMLLQQRADSVLNIALESGFKSETHFIASFKKIYGVTPSQYRLTAR